MEKIKHPMLVNMHYAFHDRDHLYLVLDYLSGGDLRYQMKKRRVFTENEISKKTKKANF